MVLLPMKQANSCDSTNSYTAVQWTSIMFRLCELFFLIWTDSTVPNGNTIRNHGMRRTWNVAEQVYFISWMKTSLEEE